MELPSRIDGPVAVIGDVHGQIDKLEVILSRLQTRPDFSDRWIVFIGDLVDRGPNPAAATEAVLSLMKTHGRVTAVCGNHELAMCGSLHLFTPPDYADWDQRWVGHYDSHTTFGSYGAEFGDMPALLDAMPQAHRDFYSALPWCVEHPQYLFVHAGLESHQPYEMQVGILRARDYSLTRPPWLCSKSLVSSAGPPDSPVAIVSGHVRVEEVAISDQRILIDTTGGTEGDLSCVLLPENEVITSAAHDQPDPGRPVAARPEPVPHGGSMAAEKPARAWWKLW